MSASTSRDEEQPLHVQGKTSQTTRQLPPILRTIIKLEEDEPVKPWSWLTVALVLVLITMTLGVGM
jgi:hypothetical protein